LKQKSVLFIMLIVLIVIAGCGGRSGTKLPVSGEKLNTTAAPILNAEGNKIGEATFIETKDGLTISIKAEGLPPGTKGVHIHETGACLPPDFTSAGGHFNPSHKEHGVNNPKGYHLGDLPNIEVNSEGKIDASLTTKELTLKPGVKNSILDHDGSALVIHEKADDYKTDPSGNSGNRIACAAVIHN
jgi:superoxide dismutase, Cu-Zn family